MFPLCTLSREQTCERIGWSREEVGSAEGSMKAKLHRAAGTSYYLIRGKKSTAWVGFYKINLHICARAPMGTYTCKFSFIVYLSCKPPLMLLNLLGQCISLFCLFQQCSRLHPSFLSAFFSLYTGELVKLTSTYNHCMTHQVSVTLHTRDFCFDNPSTNYSTPESSQSNMNEII